eukprot:m.320008 g.320008  ORF g.320008 m.320008 type:complete len:252 (+) comp20314_c0_seq1:630-1385(+)
MSCSVCANSAPRHSVTSRKPPRNSRVLCNTERAFCRVVAPCMREWCRAREDTLMRACMCACVCIPTLNLSAALPLHVWQSTQRALADSEAQQMQTNRELDVLKFASTTHVAFAPLAPTASVPHLTHKSNPAGDDMVHKYQALEDEHSEAVRTLAAQDEALRQSARRERKLKKLLTSMVDTTTASEREAQRSALALQKLKAQGKKKDKALQHLVHQLSDSRSEADMTRANATMAVQEAAMIVRGRHKSHGRR